MTASKLVRKPGHDLVSGIIYGPVQSRRLGWSLGINWFAPLTKVCNFDCVYCQLGRTTRRPVRTDFVSVDSFQTVIEQKFKSFRDQHQTIHVITISGNGEPLLHPHLPELVDLLLGARDHYLPDAKIWILTNGTRLDRPETAKALNRLDERAIKLDGVNNWLVHVDQPLYGFSLEKLLAGLSMLKDYHLQVMLLHGIENNASPRALEAWCDFVLKHQLHPKTIQLYTVDRYPAYPNVTPLSDKELEEAAAFLRQRLPFPVDVFI